MDRIHQHDKDKPGCGRSYDGGCRFFHCKCYPGGHPAQNGMLMSKFYFFISLFSQKGMLGHVTVYTS